MDLSLLCIESGFSETLFRNCSAVKNTTMSVGQQQFFFSVLWLAATYDATAALGHVVPGKVLPTWPQTWDMRRSTGMMVCNSTGAVDPALAAPWGMVDLDWNGGKNVWSATKPMSAEEFMLANILAIRAVNPNMTGWVSVRGKRATLVCLMVPLQVYRNGIKALPWHTTVRTLLEDKAQWGLFMPRKGCMPSPGEYICGDNATTNLYHDFEQTPRGDCGNGVECGEVGENNDHLAFISTVTERQRPEKETRISCQSPAVQRLATRARA